MGDPAREDCQSFEKITDDLSARRARLDQVNRSNWRVRYAFGIPLPVSRIACPESGTVPNSAHPGSASRDPGPPLIADPNFVDPNSSDPASGSRLPHPDAFAS
jgi:hypothetical protein